MDQVQRHPAEDPGREGAADLRGGGELQPAGGLGAALADPRGCGAGERPKPFEGLGGWRCPRLWPGSVIACLGGGPSLRADDVERLRAARDAAGGALRVICVNDAIRLAHWADVLYAADTSWWDRVGVHVRTDALRISCQETVYRDVRVLRYRPGPILETDPQWVATGRQPGSLLVGGNSGHQAVNVAVHLGARRIVLLGYDMDAGELGELHWFGAHPVGLTNPDPGNFAAWRQGFDRLAPELAALGVEVVNCSRRTALTCFPRAPLEEVLAWP